MNPFNSNLIFSLAVPKQIPLKGIKMKRAMKALRILSRLEDVASLLTPQNLDKFRVPFIGGSMIPSYQEGAELEPP